MAIYTLEFLNKNKFRRFPFRKDANLCTVDGRILNNDLIVGISVTSTGNRKNLHISQIYVKDQFIDLVLACTEGDKTVSLGRFAGDIFENYSVLYLEQFVRFVNGILILGNVETIKNMEGGYFFQKENSRLEDSVVFYYTPPKVKSLQRDGVNLRGKVEFGVLTNLVKTRENNVIKLSAVAGAQIASLTDRASQFRNCKTPLIFSLNDAVPFRDINKNYSALDGNIYMVGIKPIIFYGEFGTPETTGGVLQAQTIDINNNPLTLDTLCTARNKVLPPINPVYLNNRPDEVSAAPIFEGKKNYYTKSFSPPVNFIKVVEPEFLSWPQFFKNFTGFVINKPQGTQQDIITVPQSVTGTKIKRVVLRNSANIVGEGATLGVVLKKNDVTVDAMQFFQISASQAITIANTEVAFVPGDRFSIYLDSVQGTSYALQVILFYR